MSAEYHAETDTLSSSQLKVFIKSRTDYYEQFVTGRMPKKQPTAQMEVGTIVHAILLEGKKLDDMVRNYPPECYKKTKDLKLTALNPVPAEAFRDSIYPAIAMKDAEINRVANIISRARSSRLSEVLSSDFVHEQRVDAVLNGVACRCKPDIHSVVDGSSVVIYDLKIVERIYPDDWWRTAKNLLYHVQASHYSRICRQHYGLPTSFKWWAIEANYPHRVRPYWLDSRSQEISDDFHEKKLEEFAGCREQKEWEDSWDGSGTISPWDVGANDDGEIESWDEEQ